MYSAAQALTQPYHILVCNISLLPVGLTSFHSKNRAFLVMLRYILRNVFVCVLLSKMPLSELLVLSFFLMPDYLPKFSEHSFN